MAHKPTIYKVELQLVDMNRDIYTSCKLTLAQHPSETLERMMIRLMVFGLNYHEDLQFSRGLSATDEPDIWECSLDGQVNHWIEVGQATPERIRKAISRSPKISLYAFGREADIWWARAQDAFRDLPRVDVWQFNAEESAKLSDLIERTVSITMTITGAEIFLNKDEKQLSLGFKQLL
ncbi:YaeQ family protein [Neptunomonas sp.]|uniref:YaeQ family protein n=1 Tax=Neptunomonas sp. TaxID=1971898 RepID=UPI0025DD546C|nr:YaeQ family protein [Neptunomonas sp.]